jgi:CRP-like cAMP-binding protein
MKAQELFVELLRIVDQTKETQEKLKNLGERKDEILLELKCDELIGHLFIDPTQGIETTAVRNTNRGHRHGRTTTTTEEAILAFLKRQGQSYSRRDIALSIGIRIGTVSPALSKLASAGIVEHVGRLWGIAHEHDE